MNQYRVDTKHIIIDSHAYGDRIWWIECMVVNMREEEKRKGGWMDAKSWRKDLLQNFDLDNLKSECGLMKLKLTIMYEYTH